MGKKIFTKKRLSLLILLLFLFIFTVVVLLMLFFVNKDKSTYQTGSQSKNSEIELNEKGLPATLDGVYSYSYDLTQHSDTEYLSNAKAVLGQTYSENDNSSAEDNKDVEQDKESQNDKVTIFDILATPFNSLSTSFFSGFKDNSIGESNAENLVYYRTDWPNRTMYIRGDKLDDSYTESSTDNLPAWHEWFSDPWACDNLFKVVIETPITPKNTTAWFSAIHEQSQDVSPRPKIQEFVGLDNINMQNVTDSSFMFCDNLYANIQWKPDNIDKIENAFAMFSWTGASSDTLNHFAKNLTNNKVWAFTFSNNDNLSTIDVGNINFTNATNVSSMFCRNSNLTTITNIENKSVSTASSLSSMFYDCPKLQEVNAPNLCSGNVSSITGVFANSGVQTVRLDNWNCDNVTNFYGAFFNCKKLSAIYAGEDAVWGDNLTTSQEVFTGCSLYLVGALGSRFNENSTDLSYAHVDEGSKNPGYFYGSNMHFAYAVSVYDVDTESEQNNLIFGPATGYWSSSLCVDGYSNNHNTNAAETHCIHTDSWEEICQNITEGHADYYSNCVSYGCTKDVYLSNNTKLFSTYPDGFVRCSALINYIKGAYRPTGVSGECYTCINDTSTTESFESANWSTCKMRSTLNGDINGWTASDYAGNDCCNNTDCLLSCFPEVLRNNIKNRTHKICTSWDITPPYDTDEDNLIEVSDKLWFPTCSQIFTKHDNFFQFCGPNPEEDELFDKFSSSVTRYNSTIPSLMTWDESGNITDHWLLSPLRLNKNTFVFSNQYGNVFNGSDVSTSANAIAPFFML